MAKRTKTYVGSLCYQLKYSNEVFKKNLGYFQKVFSSILCHNLPL